MSASSRPRTTPFSRLAASLAALLLVGVSLSACAPESASSAETPTPATTPTDDSVDPSASPDADADAEPEPTGDPRADDLSSAVASGNTAAIEGYLTDPTRVVIAASEADMQYSPVDAVLAIDYVQPGVGVWTFDLDDAVLASYAASSFYGQFFPADAVVGASDAGAVISFVPNGSKIGTIFMAIHESLITE